MEQKEPAPEPKKEKQSLTEFMSEKRLADRWLIVKVALAGVFVGVVLATIFFLRAIIPWY